MPITGTSAALRIRLNDKSLVEGLKWYLESVECSVRVVGQVTLDVSIPRAPSDAQALSTIATYVNAWQAMNPGTYARIVGEGQAEPPSSQSEPGHRVSIR